MTSKLNIYYNVPVGSSSNKGIGATNGDQILFKQNKHLNIKQYEE